MLCQKIEKLSHQHGGSRKWTCSYDSSSKSNCHNYLRVEEVAPGNLETPRPFSQDVATVPESMGFCKHVKTSFHRGSNAAHALS